MIIVYYIVKYYLAYNIGLIGLKCFFLSNENLEISY